jgi:CRISPR-associated protein Csb2
MAQAQAQALYGSKALPLIFHGHEDDRSPARSGNHEHLFYAAFSSDESDTIDRVAVMAPGLCDRSISGRQHYEDLARAMQRLRGLRCGPDGVLLLKPVASDEDDAVFGGGRVWTTVTGYRPTRHPKRHQNLSSFLELEVRTECARRGLPIPISVQLLNSWQGPRGQSPISAIIESRRH